MDDCCQARAQEIEQAHGAFGRVLWVVLAINAAMFVAEFGAGLVARSTALMADSLDMFGDAGIYALSLYALHRSARWKAGAALAKSLLMAAFGLVVIGDVTLKIAHGVAPSAPMMGGFGLLALAANLTCALLLLRFRAGEINMRSTWLCSRTDVLANLGVLVAAGLVAATQSLWPDVAIGLLIAGVFLHSALGVFREALGQLGAGAEAA
ncbi:MAG: cation transporter [Candidatus Lambdaproteobacteria bacterium]|nr:cation transporter [Candidatus Lambdaproteobacteria bacterium]